MMSNGAAMQQMYPQLFAGMQQQQGGAVGAGTAGSGGGNDDLSNSGQQGDGSRKSMLKAIVFDILTLLLF